MKVDPLSQDWLVFCFVSFHLEDTSWYSGFQPVLCVTWCLRKNQKGLENGIKSSKTNSQRALLHCTSTVVTEVRVKKDVKVLVLATMITRSPGVSVEQPGDSIPFFWPFRLLVLAVFHMTLDQISSIAVHSSTRKWWMMKLTHLIQVFLKVRK